MKILSPFPLLGAVMAAGLTACGGEKLVLPSEGEPASIVLVQGGDQSGRVGEALPRPLVLQVADGAGRPVSGATVVVEVEGAETRPDTVTTEPDGLATVGVVLGPAVGPAPGAARVLTPAGQDPVQVEFTVVAVAASAAGLALELGNDQAAPVGSTLADPLVVRVIDQFGNPIPGMAITWTTVGGGSVSQPSTTSDENGRASVSRTLGSTAGLQTTLAASQGLAGSPVTFAHTAMPGSASGVAIVSGNQQSGQSGTPLAQPLIVRVTDAAGNPIVGAAVTWIVTGGGGRLDPVTSSTDAGGLASSTWTLGASPGGNTAEAVVSGVGQASFSATALAGPPDEIRIVSGDGQTGPPGQRLDGDLVVVVLDQGDNPVAGAGVTWQVRSGGGSVDAATAVTDAGGRASTRWTLGPGAGTQTVAATVTGAGSVTFQATAAQSATTTRITGDDPEPSEPGAGVTVRFTVTSNGGTPAGTVTVTVSGGAETCSAEVAAGSCIITLTGEGSRTLTARYQGSALFAASEDTESHQVESANATPSAAADAYTVPGPGATLEVPAPGVLLNDTDPDGDPLEAELVTGVANGSLTLDRSGGFTYTPAAGFSGQDSFTYRAQDAGSSSDAATVVIDVPASP